MKVFVVMCLVAVAVAAPQNRGNARFSPNDVQIQDYYFDNIGVGPYSFRFQQSDGTNRQEQGTLRNEGQENEYIAVEGSYGYIGPDGVNYNVKYKADENGFQPTIEAPGGAVPDSVVASLLG